MQNQVAIGVIVAYEQTDGKLSVTQIPQALNGLYRIQLLYPSVNEIVSGVPLSLLPHANNFSQYSYVSYKVGDKVYLLHLYENLYLILGSAGNVADTDLWHNRHIIHNSMFGNEISIIEPYLDAYQFSSGIVINTNNIYIGTGQIILPKNLSAFKTIDLSFDEFVSNTLHPILSNMQKYTFDAKNARDSIVNSIRGQSNTYIRANIPDQTIYLGSVYYNYSLIPSSRNLTIGLQSVFKKDVFSSQTIFKHVDNKLPNTFLYNIDAHHYVNNIYDIHKYSNINTTYIYYTHDNNSDTQLYTKQNYASQNKKPDSSQLDTSEFVWKPSLYKSYKVIETEQRFANPVPTRYYSIQTFSLSPLVNSNQFTKNYIEKFESATYYQEQYSKAIQPKAQNVFDYYYTVNYMSLTQNAKQIQENVIKVVGEYKADYGRDSFVYYTSEQLSENHYSKTIAIGSARGNEESYVNNDQFLNNTSNVLYINLTGSATNGGSIYIVCSDNSATAIFEMNPTKIVCNVKSDQNYATISIMPQYIELKSSAFIVIDSPVVKISTTAFIQNAQCQSIAWNSAVGPKPAGGGALNPPSASPYISSQPKIPAHVPGLSLPQSITTIPGSITEALKEYVKPHKTLAQISLNNTLYNLQKTFNDFLTFILTNPLIPRWLFTITCLLSTMLSILFNLLTQFLNLLIDNIAAFLANFIAAISQVLSFLNLVVNKVKELIQKIVDIIAQVINAVTKFVDAMINMIFDAINAIITLVNKLINAVLEFIGNMLFEISLVLNNFLMLLSSLFQFLSLIELLLNCLKAPEIANAISSSLITPLLPISITSPPSSATTILIQSNISDYTIPAISFLVSDTSYLNILDYIRNSYNSSYTANIAAVDPTLLIHNMQNMMNYYSTIQNIIDPALTDSDKQIANDALTNLQNGLNTIKDDVEKMFNDVLTKLDVYKHC